MPEPDKRMPCLTVRQPWAWMIIHVGKDIENRSWPTKFRGRILIRAAKTFTWDDYEWAKICVACKFSTSFANEIPCPGELKKGGIIGSVEIVDCVTKSNSLWFDEDGYGLILRNPVTLPFEPCKWRTVFEMMEHKK